MILVVASNNAHKVEEIKSYLKDYFEDIKSLKEMGISIDIEETGTTFLENSLIKARAITSLTGFASIADDSGLCVDKLNGEPGVYSARYAGEPCNDDNNNNKLLKVLKEKGLEKDEDRKAHFTSVVVLNYPDGTYKVGEGKVEGVILHERRGNGGFGYDPLFLSTELNKTFAEINLSEKNTVSHRARALENLLKQL